MSKVEQEPIIPEDTLLELANRENELILSGKRIEPTAYAPRSHTDIHLAFMSSDKFKQTVGVNQEILANMIYHALGEGEAQQLRQQGGQGNELGRPTTSMGGPQGSVSQGVMASEAKAAMPGRVIGSEEGLT